MISWEKVKIKDIANTMSGGTPNRSILEFYEHGDIPWLKTGELKKKFIYHTEEMITELAVQKSSAKIVPENSVIVAMYGATVGNLSINKIPLTTNQACCSILPKEEKLDGEFLYYYLSRDKEKLIKMAAGGAQPNISQQLIKDYEILIPSLKEQKKIAEILSSVDAAIEKTEQVIAKTEEIKKGLMQQLLTKGIGHTEFKQTEIGEIPENWDIKHLGDITKVCVGFVGSINAYYTNDKENGVLLLRTSNISCEGLNLTDTKYVTKEFHAKNKKSQLSSGDIIISRHGESGTASVIPESIVEANCLNVVCVKKTKEIDSFYLEALFNSEIIKRQMKQAVVGSVQGVVNTTTISNALIPIPPTEEQKEIRSILFSLNNKISNELKKLHTINIIKQGLMQQLLTGQVLVKVD